MNDENLMQALSGSRRGFVICQDPLICLIKLSKYDIIYMIQNVSGVQYEKCHFRLEIPHLRRKDT